MNIRNILSAALLGTFVLTSCSSDEAADEMQPREMRFSISTDGTRASHDDVMSIKNIHLRCILNDNGPHDITPGENGMITIPVESGEVVNPTKIFWPDYTSKIHVYALVGENITTVNDTYEINFNLEENQTEDSYGSDLMCCHKYGSYSELTNNGVIDLHFGHVLSEVQINIRGGQDDTADDITDVTIKGTYCNAVYDYSVNYLSYGSSIYADVKPYAVSPEQGSTASYRCLLIPQTTDNMEIYFNYKGKIYTWRPQIEKMAVGTRYNFDLDLNGQGIKSSAERCSRRPSEVIACPLSSVR